MRWLRAEAQAGRIPCIDADGALLFHPETVERVLLKRARGTAKDGKSRKEAANAPP